MKREWLLGFLCVFAHFCVFAATERITDYQYDPAGNLVRILSDEQSAPPDVVAIDPPFINLGRSVSMTATGSNLLGAQVSVNDPGLSISSVLARKDRVTFRLTALPTATIGQVSINFTTGLGSDSEIIDVAESLPDLFTTPSPIVLPVSNQPTTVELRFDTPRPNDETYTVSVTDPQTATVAQSTLTVLAGETLAQIDLTGVALGSTELNIVLANKFYFFSFPVFVSSPYLSGSDVYTAGSSVGVFLDSGAFAFQNPVQSGSVGVFVADPGGEFSNPVISAPVGIFLEDANGSFSNPVNSAAVGVFVESANGGVGNPLLALPVGIFVESNLGGAGNPLLALPVGLFFESAGGGFGNPVLSQSVGAVLGPLLDSVTPTQLNPGDALNLTVSGFNLENVSSVTVVPAGAINVGAFTAKPDGSELTVPVTVDPAANSGSYELIIETPQEVVKLPGGHNLTLTIP